MRHNESARRPVGSVVTAAALALVAGIAGIVFAGGLQWQPRTGDAMESGRAEVWLAPFPLGMRGALWQDGYGSADFMALFEPETRWRTADEPEVFKFYFQWALQVSDRDLKVAVDGLNRRGIAIAMEGPSFDVSDSCGHGVEGFTFDALGSVTAAGARIAAAGGELKYLALDEPLAFGSIYEGLNACRWKPAETAARLAAFVEDVHAALPGVQIGTIEPDWTPIDALAEFLEAFRSASSQELAFLHWDVNWSLPDWPRKAKSAEFTVHDRSIPFGMIYTGDFAAADDERWVSAAGSRAAAYEGMASGLPEHVVFQSWHERPRRLLPAAERRDAGAPTFVGLVSSYRSRRASLTVIVDQGSGDGYAVRGLLHTADTASPLGGRPLSIEIRATDGPGVERAHIVRGAVPADATEAVVGFRVNMECLCGGPAALRMFAPSLEQDGIDLLAGSGFDDAANRWEIFGPLAAERNDDGRPQIRLEARGNQASLVNSPRVPVRGGAEFTVTMPASVSPRSAGAGYFVVIFLRDGQEVGRRTLAFPVETHTYAVTTGRDGVFRLNIGAIDGATVAVATALFAGDSEFARASGWSAR